MSTPAILTDRTCTIDGCGKPIDCKGLCGAHYNRLLRHGDPLGGGTTQNRAPTLAERLWPRVDKSGDCWEWTGTKDSHGYGQLRFRGVLLYVHRVAWELANGPIPDGLVIDHICRNPLCVQPDHLQVVTPGENNENREVSSPRSSSGVRGVSWHGRYQKWEVSARHNGRRHYGGRFADLVEAARAAIALRNSLHTNNLLDRIHEAAR